MEEEILGAKHQKPPTITHRAMDLHGALQDNQPDALTQSPLATTLACLVQVTDNQQHHHHHAYAYLSHCHKNPKP